MLYHFDDFVLDTLRRELSHSGEGKLSMPPRALDLLLLLVRNRDRVLSKDELREALWPDTSVAEASLFECVAVARRTLGGSGGRRIRTVHGRGYAFAGEIDEVRAPSSTPATWDEPGRVFVGRRDLLLAFEQILEKTLPPARPADRRGALLLVAGEPGLGKSRLLEEFAVLAKTAGCATMQGRCSEIEGAPPYWPWLQVLRALQASVPNAAEPALWNEVHAAGSSPSKDGSLAREGSAARFRWFDSIGELLRRATLVRPCVILLDDVHRADLPSLRLLTYVTEELRKLGLVIVAAHREFELRHDAARSAALSQIARALPAKSMRLEGLSREEVEEFARALVDDDAAPALAGRLHEHTAGNPFFVVQLLGLIGDGGGRAALSRDLPPTVRGAVVRHLDALPGETRRLLAIASVLGREFDLDLLARIGGLAEDRVLHDLTPAFAAGVLSAPPAGRGLHSFRHILVRDALYDEWPEHDRARWHLRAADAMRQRHGTAPGNHSVEIASHLRRALPMARVEDTIQSATAAGRWAREQLAFEEAAAQFEWALELGDLHGALAPGERCDLLIELGAAFNASGSRPAARRALGAAATVARGLGDWRRLAAAALGASPGFFAIEAGVEDRPLIDMLEAALSLCPATEPRIRAQLLCRLAMALYWSADAEQGHLLADEACDLARITRNEHLLAQAAVTHFQIRWSAENLEDRSRAADRMVRMAELAGDMELSLMARVFRMSTLLELGDVTRFNQENSSLRSLVETGRHPHATWYPLLYDATLSLLRGRLSDVERLIQEVRLAGERFSDANVGHSIAVDSMLIGLMRGDLKDCLAIARLASGEPSSVAAHRSAVALFAALADRRDEAASEIQQLCAHDFSAIPRDMLWLLTVTILAEATSLLGDQKHARSCYRRLQPFGGRFAVVGHGIAVWSPVDRILGVVMILLGEYTKAENHLRDALAMCERIGARTIAVHTRWNWGQLLEARSGPGDAARKRQVCEPALREARELGLTFFARQLEDLLNEG